MIFAKHLCKLSISPFSTRLIDIHMASLISSVETGTWRPGSSRPRYPLELKIALTLFVICADFISAWVYGPWNFLWFCNLALHLTLIALWLENRLLLSMQAVGIVTMQSVWTLDYLARLFLGFYPLGLVHYVFIGSHPLLHALTLFHIWLPLLLLFVVRKTGYDRRALLLQLPVFWLVLLICIRFAPPTLNINLTTEFMEFSFVEQITALPISKWAGDSLSRYIEWRQSLPPLAVQGMDLTYMLTLGPLVLLLPAHLVLVRYFCKKSTNPAEFSMSVQASPWMRLRRWFWESPMQARQPGFLTVATAGTQYKKQQSINMQREYQQASAGSP